jgi:hypothetical protein
VSYVSSFHIPVEKRVPIEARGKMMSVPNDVEIKKVMQQLGPDKALGPDGVTACFLQMHWEVVGPQVCKEI